MDSRDSKDAKNQPDDVDVKCFTGCFTTQRSEPECSSRRNIEVEPVVLPTAIDSLTYKMDHGNRGKCIIFSHKKFDSHLQLHERKETDKDVQKLNECLKKYGFDVMVYQDLRYEVIFEKIGEVALEDHSKNDCLMIIILTHGNEDPYEGEILYARNRHYKLELITSAFNGVLVGKPKIFIIQACRGRKLDAGIVVAQGLQSDGFTAIDSITQKLPIQADLLIVHSTPPGHYSFKNTGSGSYLVKYLVEELNKNYQEQINDPEKKMEFLNLLRIVNRRICYEFESNVTDPKKQECDKKKQTISFTSTLTRFIYLTPKELNKEK